MAAQTSELEDLGRELEDFERVFGPDPETLQTVPLNTLNIFGQYRTRYNDRDQAELGHSIDKTGMRNAILVCEMSAEEARVYMDYANRTWKGKKVAFDDLTPNADGNYYVVMAGHRRTLSIRSLATKDKTPENAYGVRVFVSHDRTILDIMRIQGSENVQVPPKPQDKAVLIQQMYLFGMEHGIYEGTADFISDSPYSVHETADALKYVCLPDEVQVYVEAGTLPYSAAIAFYPLLERYYNYYKARKVPAEKIELKIESGIMSDVRHIVAQWAKPSGDKVRAFVKDRKLQLQEEPGVFDAENFWSSEDHSVERTREQIAAPAIALLLREAQNVQGVLDVLNSYGGISGWRADVKLDKRRTLAEALAITLDNTERVIAQADQETLASMPQLQKFYALAEDLLARIYED